MGVYNNASTCNWASTDACDKCAVLVSLLPNANRLSLPGNPLVADIDIVIARGEIYTGSHAQSDIAAAGGVKQRLKTVGRVPVAGCVVFERFNTVGRVEAALCVARERLKTVGRVVAALCVAAERVNTVGRVEAALRVVVER